MKECGRQLHAAHSTGHPWQCQQWGKINIGQPETHRVEISCTGACLCELVGQELPVPAIKDTVLGLQCRCLGNDVLNRLFTKFPPTHGAFITVQQDFDDTVFNLLDAWCLFRKVAAHFLTSNLDQPTCEEHWLFSSFTFGREPDFLARSMHGNPRGINYQWDETGLDMRK